MSFNSFAGLVICREQLVISSPSCVGRKPGEFRAGDSGFNPAKRLCCCLALMAAPNDPLPVHLLH